MARSSLNYFSEYMGYRNANFHFNLYNFLQFDFGPFNPQKKYLILWPRGHSKTECASINYPTWLIGNHPNLHINLVTKTATLGEEILTAIITRIESDKNFNRLFPDVKPKQPKKWMSKEIIVKRSEISKNPSIKASGLMGPITGGRSDLIICDDIIDEENIRTRLQLEKVDTWFNKVLYPTLYPWGAILVIGTRWSYADIYAKLLQHWPHDIKQAIVDESSQSVMWPEYWSYNKLIERRNEIGSIFFNCQYQNDPTGMQGDLLKAEWLHPWNEPPNDCIKYAGLDPSLGEGDKFGIATVSLDRRSRQAYLEDVYYADGFIDGLNHLKYLHNIHHYARIFLESNAFQKVLMYLPELRSLPTTPTPTHRDKETRFIAMSSHFEASRVLVNPLLITPNHQFWLEWVQFPRGQHDDGLDAVEIALRNTIQRSGQPRGRSAQVY